MKELVNIMMAFFLVASFGFFIGKKKLLSQDASNQLSSILVIYIFSITMVRSFIRPFNIEELKIVALVFVLSFIIKFILIILTKIIFAEEERIERYAVIFDNKGFVGIPLITAVLGPEYVIYVVPSIIVSNILVWTYGSRLLGAKVAMTPKALIFNPSIISFVLGLILFILPIELPEFLLKGVDMIASINSPLAMILLGYFISKESMGPAIKNKKVWKTVFTRLILVPIIVMGLLKLFPIGDRNFNLVMVMMWATPTAMNLSLMVSHSGKDPTYAAQVTAATAIMAVVTIPIILSIGQYLF